MADLSVLITARNEEYLPHTIADVFQHARGDTEVIAVCDGGWPLSPIPDNPRLRLILPLDGGDYLEHSYYSPVSPDAARDAKPAVIGQRAGVNLAARLSTATFIQKLDAHCSLDDGFDVKLMAPYDTGEIGPDTITIPAMINLHVFNWRCKNCGRETYQGPKPVTCEEDKERDRTMAEMPRACGSTAGFEKVLVWQPRRRKAAGNGSEGRGGHARTEFWRVDHELHFQYHGPRAKGEPADAEIADVMSSVGACFFMRRDRFWELDGLDESHGSWGAFGAEIALKSWLSGGRHVVNRRTFFCHMFRTRGGFSFPYAIQPSDQSYAREYSKNLWMGDLWPKQTRPLLWLIEHFWPIRGWSDPDGAAALSRVREAANRFRVRSARPCAMADHTAAMAVDGGREEVSVLAMREGGLPSRGIDAWFPGPECSPSALPVVRADRANAERSARKVARGRQRMSIDAVGLGAVDGGHGGGASQVVDVEHQGQVGRITTGRVVADDMIQFGDVPTETTRNRLNEPREHQARQPECLVGLSGAPSQPCQADLSVPVPVATTVPDPAASDHVNRDVAKQSGDGFAVDVGDCEKLIVSHAVPPSQVSGRLGPADVCASSGPSIVPQMQPSFGVLYYSDCRGDARILQAVRDQIQRSVPADWPIVSVTLRPVAFGTNIVLPLERSVPTMFRQILVGLEALETDYVFFAEHDCLYTPDHFQFLPARRDCFYYNQNRVQVDAVTGRAVHYRCCQTSGLCADRQLLLAHYRKRVELVERDGFSRSLGFEPGSNSRSRAIDGVGFEAWMAAAPNLDIRHGKNLTATRWDQSQFRNKNSCQGWTEMEDIPYWGVTLGRFDQFLAELARPVQTEGAA